MKIDGSRSSGLTKNRKLTFQYAEDFSEGRTSEARFSYGESVLS
jgi:hypothetical protein